MTRIDLIYNAYTKKIPLNTTDPDTYEVIVPRQFLAALLAYVGYREHVALPAGDAFKAREHLSRYNGMCNEIRLLGTFNKPKLTNMKSHDQGFLP